MAADESNCLCGTELTIGEVQDDTRVTFQVSPAETEP